MTSDRVLCLRHKMGKKRPCHDVASLLKEFSLSESCRARVQWSSGIELHKMQVIISHGINRFGYSGYMGTRIDEDELYVYKKAAYDPVLLSMICVGPMANLLNTYMSDRHTYERQLNDLGMFCRWATRETLFERIARTVLTEHGNMVSASTFGMTSYEIDVIMETLAIMRFNRSINSSGECIFINLNREETHGQY